MIKNAESMKE